MRLLLIATLVGFSAGKSMNATKCPKINRSSENYLFPHNIYWRIYAFSDPGMETMSLFSLYENKIDLKSNCLKFESFSKIKMALNCFNSIPEGSLKILQIIKIFLNESKQESQYSKFYSTAQKFSDISILDTDQDSFITFYGCKEADGYALEGILILIREDKFENFSESKLELSYELLKPSFGFKFVEEIDDTNRSGKCDCSEVYNDLLDVYHSGNIIFKMKKKNAMKVPKRILSKELENKYPILIVVFVLTLTFGMFVFLITINRINDNQI